MGGRQRLRAVEPKDKPDLSSVAAAAEFGTPLDEMRAIRARIARVIDDPKTSARDLAALTRRQLEVSKEVRALEQRAKDDGFTNRGDQPWDASMI